MYSESSTVCVPPPLQFLKDACTQDTSSHGWEADEGSSYEGSSCISAEVECCPEQVTIRADGYPIKGGLYKKVPGCEYNGNAVWCSGTWRLYSGKKGYWLLAECSEDMLEQKGFLRSTHLHYGTDPTKANSWQLHTPYGWAPSAVVVTSLFHGLAGDVGPNPFSRSVTTSEESSESELELPPVLSKPGPIHSQPFSALRLESLEADLSAPVGTISMEEQPKLPRSGVAGKNTLMTFLKQSKKRKVAKNLIPEKKNEIVVENCEVSCGQAAACSVM